jgi:hypothetical protein
MQEGQVFFYESHKLRKHDQKYVTHDLELVEIEHVPKMWRLYLIERIFILMTDHFGLNIYSTIPS